MPLVRNEVISNSRASETSGDCPSMTIKCRWGASVLPSLYDLPAFLVVQSGFSRKQSSNLVTGGTLSMWTSFDSFLRSSAIAIS